MQIIYMLKQQPVGKLGTNDDDDDDDNNNNNNNNNNHVLIQFLEHARAPYHTKLQSTRKFFAARILHRSLGTKMEFLFSVR